MKQLHNKHKGSTVWIVGSDPTLDKYPNDFLDNELAITLHMAYIKFPKAKYHHFNEYDRLEFLKKEYPKIKKKSILVAMPFYNRTLEESQELMKDISKTYSFNLHPYPPNNNREDIMSKVGFDFMANKVKEAIKGNTDFGGYGTCLHAALYNAILMGATTINLIGNGHESKHGADHFGKVEKLDKVMRPQASDFSAPTRAPYMKRGTEAIIEGCGKLKIKVNWFKSHDEAVSYV